MTQYRARTGCLTCRNRHIKCDEATPRCQNCSRSNRKCERGLRLNFIDIQTSTPHPAAKLRPGTKLIFRDESRSVASIYNFNATVKHAPVPEVHELYMQPQFMVQDGDSLPVGKAPAYKGSLSLSPSSQDGSSRLIGDMDESLLMEVYVQKVAPWLDCLDTSYKPFTNILPLYALSEPMLYSSMMLCSMRYLSLDDVGYEPNLQCRHSQPLTDKPGQQQLICMATKILLSASDVISGGTDQTHMNHATILLREANISGSSAGLPGTLFWSHALMQLTYCIYHNVPPSLDLVNFGHTVLGQNPPVDAGQDILFGQETYWVRRIIYICTRVSVLHAEMTQNLFQYSDEKMRADCEEYRNWCRDWASSVPRSMTPLCYVPPSESKFSTSTPYVLLISSNANISRLLYHTACLLIADMMRIDEMASEYSEVMQRRHAMDICGIASQAEERAFTHVAACCLMVAVKALPENSRERREALDILDRITHGTPLALGRINLP